MRRNRLATLAVAGCLLAAAGCSGPAEPDGTTTATSSLVPSSAPSDPTGSATGSSAAPIAPTGEPSAAVADAPTTAAGPVDGGGAEDAAGAGDAGELGTSPDAAMPELVGVPVPDALITLGDWTVELTDASGATVSAADGLVVCHQTPAADQPLDASAVILVVATAC